VTLAISVLLYIVLVVALFALVLSAGESSTGSALSVTQAAPPAAADESSTAGAGTAPAATEEGPATSGASWTVATILPVLGDYADDEAEDWAAFDGEAVVTIPCGGEGAHGVSQATIETIAGGSQYGASAQVLPDGGSADRELERLRSLAADCGPHDYISKSSGVVLTRCEPLVVESLAPVLRYEEVCDIDPGVAYAFAVFRAGNAVVGLSAPSVSELDAALPHLLEVLHAD
jgi:hypothetical protein